MHNTKSWLAYSATSSNLNVLNGDNHMFSCEEEAVYNWMFLVHYPYIYPLRHNKCEDEWLFLLPAMYFFAWKYVGVLRFNTGMLRLTALHHNHVKHKKNHAIDGLK